MNTDRADEARRTLYRRQDALARQGIVAACTDDRRFISGDYRERQAVIPLCAPCPLLEECRRVAQHEVDGVWGGIDRSAGRRPSKENT